MAGIGVWGKLAAALCAAVVALLAPATASATYPGANGPILILDPGTATTGVSGLTAVDPNTGAWTRIADRIGDDASVSADGRFVVYTRPNAPVAPDFIPSSSLFMSSIDGTGERLIFEQPYWPIGELALSPDAGTIGYRSGDSPGLFSLPVTGGERAQLTAVPNDARPEYSPDGTKMLFERFDGPGKCDESGDFQRDIWIVNADGTGARPVADNPIRGETEPRFTPDGKRITYQRTHGPITCKEDQPALPTAVHSIRLNGEGDRMITKADYKEKGLPIPSPDGKRLLLIRKFKLITVPMDGKGKATRVPSPPGVPIAWAPAAR